MSEPVGPAAAVRLIIANAQAAEPASEIPPAEPPTSTPTAMKSDDAGEDLSAPRHRNSSGLPEACHIIALGTEGKTRWYIDASGQLCNLEAKEHTRTNILGMLGRYAKEAENIWPRQDKRGTILGFSAEDAAEDLFAASARRLWSPRDRARGRGFWAGGDGSLIVHAGIRLYCRKEWRATGVVLEDAIYPAAESLTMPALPADPRDPYAAGRQALQLFERWNWKRKIDARLALGCWGCLVAGGALPWRPVINVNGPPQAGKILLFRLWNALGGKWILTTEDATEAGLRQALLYDSIGLIVDEAEPGDDGKTAGITRMARRSTGGGRSRRGTTSDQRGVDFVLRSTIAIGVIERASLLLQDVSRRLTLELEKPAHDPP